MAHAPEYDPAISVVLDQPAHEGLRAARVPIQLKSARDAERGTYGLRRPERAAPRERQRTSVM